MRGAFEVEGEAVLPAERDFTREPDIEVTFTTAPLPSAALRAGPRGEPARREEKKKKMNLKDLLQYSRPAFRSSLGVCRPRPSASSEDRTLLTRACSARVIEPGSALGDRRIGLVGGVGKIDLDMVSSGPPISQPGSLFFRGIPWSEKGELTRQHALPERERKERKSAFTSMPAIARGELRGEQKRAARWLYSCELAIKGPAFKGGTSASWSRHTRPVRGGEISQHRSCFKSERPVRARISSFQRHDAVLGSHDGGLG